MFGFPFQSSPCQAGLLSRGPAALTSAKKTGSLALALQVSTGQLVKKTGAAAGHCLTEPEQSPVKDVKVKLPLYISGQSVGAGMAALTCFIVTLYLCQKGWELGLSARVTRGLHEPA